MNSLAFTANGDPIDLPKETAGLRVKRMKPKGSAGGAPELVPGEDGGPLIIPLDADIDDLRAALQPEKTAGRPIEGRYRLEAVTEDRRTITSVPPAYVYVYDLVEVKAGPAAVESGGHAGHVAIEAMKLNTELAKSIVEKFPMMMDSAAVLLRAADGAGLPARPPRPIVDEPREVEGEIDDVELDDAEIDDFDDLGGGAMAQGVPKPSGLMAMLEMVLPMVIPVVMPAVMNAIAGGNFQIPAGIGALFDCRRASPKARAQASAASAASHPSEAGSMPGRRSATSQASARSAPATSRTPTPPTDARTPTSDAARPAQEDAPGAAATTAAPGQAEAETMAEDSDTDIDPVDRSPGSAAEAAEPPTTDATTLAHFVAVQNALTLEEGMMARALASELSAGERRAWLAELRDLSVPEAVHRIQSVLHATRPAAPPSAPHTAVPSE